MINPNVTLDQVNAMSKNTMLEHLGIVITELGSDYLIGTMPVDHRTVQPMRLLHGGASMTLIESLGSIGSTLLVDMTKHNIVGIEINGNHIRAVKSGIVTGKAKIVHRGRTTHIWQVDITSEDGKLVCSGRLTTLVIDKK